MPLTEMIKQKFLISSNVIFAFISEVTCFMRNFVEKQVIICNIFAGEKRGKNSDFHIFNFLNIKVFNVEQRINQTYISNLFAIYFFFLFRFMCFTDCKLISDKFLLFYILIRQPLIRKQLAQLRDIAEYKKNTS